MGEARDAGVSRISGQPTINASIKLLSIGLEEQEALHAGTTDIDQQRTLILSLDPPSATTCKLRLVPNRGSPSMMAAEPPASVANWANDLSILAHVQVKLW